MEAASRRPAFLCSEKASAYVTHMGDLEFIGPAESVTISAAKLCFMCSKNTCVRVFD